MRRPEFKLQCAGASHTGQVRAHNEDAIAVDEPLALSLLADGLGGARGGEVASAMAVEVVASTLPELERDEETANALRAAVDRANDAVWQMAQAQPQYAGMGTTLEALLCRDGRIVIGHVGDSRVYRLRNGELEQLTRDHSVVQKVIEEQGYTPEEARRVANPHLITRALGIEAVVQCDVLESSPVPGDVYLLCSDGLTDMVPAAAIRTALLQAGDDLQQTADALIDAANAAGGTDNVSVQLVRVASRAAERPPCLARVARWFTGRAAHD